MKVISLNNEYISRSWAFNQHKLYTISIKNQQTGVEYVSEPIIENDFFYEGFTYETRWSYKLNPYKYKLISNKKEKFSKSIYKTSYEKLTIILSDDYHGVTINYIAILYDQAKAIKTYIEITTSNLPEWYFFHERFNAIDTYPINLDEANLTSCEFFTRTDYTNNLIKVNNSEYGFSKANLLFVDYDNHGLFILKESPTFTDSQPECFGHLYIGNQFIHTLGTGVMPHEFNGDTMVSYSSVIGIYEGIEDEKYISLKDYQVKDSNYYPMIMSNPWGDRLWMAHISEEFVCKEISAAAQMGAEYYQIDDGWNKGNGLIHVGYSKKMDRSFWAIDKEKFPDGFNKIVKVAKEKNIKIALWIGLDCNCLYRNYVEQANIIFDMYKKHNIKVFKIDIMKLRNYESRANIEKLFKLLREKSNGEIIFNLDVTNDKRSGYFLFNEYGVIFLENRYEGKGYSNSYSPYLTLKNQWDLAKYVPLQNLQIEFLNIRKPNYSAEYRLAITYFSNPLAWFEPSNLDYETMDIFKNGLLIYKEHRQAIFNGSILPIGQRPSGHSYTGFISYNQQEEYAYLLLFREDNENCQFTYDIPLLYDKHITNLKYIQNNHQSEVNINNGQVIWQSTTKKTHILLYLQWEND